MRNVERALVFGAGGFWGSWVVDLLVGEGCYVVGLDRSFPPPTLALRTADEEIVAELQTLALDDLLATAKPDAIFYLAGRASVPFSVEDPVGDLDGNTRDVVRVLDVLRRVDIPPVLVYASSAAVYGSSTEPLMDEQHAKNPLSPYGVSKLAAEQYVRLFATSFGVPGSSVRPFSLYGPGQRKQVIYDLAKRLADGEDPLRIFGAAEVSRDFIHVRDASRALLTVARSAPAHGEAYNVASGVETTIAQLVDELQRAVGTSVPVEFTGSVRKGDPLSWRGDIGALSALGFSAGVSLAEGLSETADWFQSHRT
jgi:UDP-glucose 4-epimerase